VYRTVDAGLERLSARLAAQITHAGLFVDFDGDGRFVIAEDTSECRGERFALFTYELCTGRAGRRVRLYLLGTGWLARLCLSFALLLLATCSTKLGVVARTMFVEN